MSRSFADTGEACLGRSRMQGLLTRMTYDDDLWDAGERPGEYKRGDVGVGIDQRVGYGPSEVAGAVDELCREVGEELESGVSPWGTLTVGCYLHAKIAEIHPFADGNGRCARLMENLVRVSLGAPPTMVREQDRLSYYGALDEFHEEGSLRGMRMFTAANVIRWFEGREG